MKCIKTKDNKFIKVSDKRADEAVEREGALYISKTIYKQNTKTNYRGPSYLSETRLTLSPKK